jgi:hypothetical protein
MERITFDVGRDRAVWLTSPAPTERTEPLHLPDGSIAVVTLGGDGRLGVRVSYPDGTEASGEADGFVPQLWRGDLRITCERLDRRDRLRVTFEHPPAR